MASSSYPAHSRHSAWLQAAARRAPRTTILHLCPDLEAGDLSREIIDLSILTGRYGWRAMIASSGGQMVLESERAAVRHIKLPLNRTGFWTSWGNYSNLKSLVMRERPALIHAHGFELFKIAIKLGRACRIPFIADFTQPMSEKINIKSLMRKTQNQNCLLRVPTDYMANYLIEVCGAPKDKVQIIPPGVDLQWFDPVRVTPERLQNISHLWRIPEQASVIIVAEPLAPQMGHATFLEALAGLGRQDIYAVLIGHNTRTAGIQAQLDNLVSHYGLHGKVVMPEYCADWPAALWLSSLVIATSTKPRGMARELLLAQAMGRPVIINDCGANREMILKGETAWIVPADNVLALTQALDEALKLDSGERAAMAVRTRDFIAEKFPKELWFDKFIEAYKALAAPLQNMTSKNKIAV